MKTLNRDAPGYRISHCCPACMHRLEDEPELKYKMLCTVDGNDSLKRIARRHPTVDGVLGTSKERIDERNGRSDYIYHPDIVNAHGKETLDPVDDDNPCSNRWHNMKENATARSLGIYEETGIVLGLCRHGFVLGAADMVRSGEQ